MEPLDLHEKGRGAIMDIVYISNYKETKNKNKEMLKPLFSDCIHWEWEVKFDLCSLAPTFWGEKNTSEEHLGQGRDF